MLLEVPSKSDPDALENVCASTSPIGGSDLILLGNSHRYEPPLREPNTTFQ